jgi:hypothetical protein
MIEPVAIEPDRFFDFVGGPGLAVVLVSIHPLHAFSETLGDRLCLEIGSDEPVAFGTLALRDLLLSTGQVLPFLQREYANCGAPGRIGLVPGYCLFRDGEMLAWSSGLPAVSDAKGIAWNSLVAAIWSGITRDASYVSQALFRAAEEAAAQRTAEAFRIAATEPNRRRAPSSSSSAPGSEGNLFWAYRVLGVSPAASDAEVRDAWRKRRTESHPDQAADDPVEFQRRSREAADINRARDIILEARRTRRATA